MFELAEKGLGKLWNMYLFQAIASVASFTTEHPLLHQELTKVSSYANNNL